MIHPVVQKLCETIVIDLSNGAGIPELVRFQEYFREYKIVACHGLSCEDIMLEGQVYSFKRINYHVITNLTAATARRYVCKACNKWYKIDVTHVCDKTCSDCVISPRVRSVVLAISVPNVTGISEVARVSRNTSGAHRT